MVTIVNNGVKTVRKGLTTGQIMNIRAKGQDGEREVANMLNQVVNDVRIKLGLTPLDKNDGLFQRNQNQSAVGGHDLSNNLDLAIEVKRQEALSINSWWSQCVKSAERSNGIPVLIFRQNRQKWRVIMNGWISCRPTHYVGHENTVRIEITLEDFLTWFTCYYHERVSRNERVSTSAKR